MTREELKGKQTRGTDYRSDKENGIGLGMIVENKGVITAHCVKWEPTEQHANAALYAEAHNVANATGMWPLDMVERIKELESALKIVQSAAKLEAAKPGPTFCEELRDALNMVDHVLSKRQ